MAEETQGVRLRRLRKRLGKTQTMVAAEVGVSKGAYSAWETDRNDLRGKYVLALCKSLACTPDDLFGYRGGSSSAAPVLLEDAYYDFFDLYERTPTYIRGAVKVIMENTAKTRRPRRR